MIANDGIFMMTLRNVYMSSKTYVMSSKTGPKCASNQNVPYDPIKKKECPHFVFSSPIRKLYALENLKWAQASKRRKQMTSHYVPENELYFMFFTCEIQLVSVSP